MILIEALTWKPSGYLKATGTLTRLGSGEPDGWKTKTASLVASSKLKYWPVRISLTLTQNNLLTLAVDGLRIDPGEELGPLPVEAGLHRGAVVVVVVLQVPQTVAVPRPSPVKLVSPVMPREAPSLKTD